MKWINVDDRLPENEQKVITIDKLGREYACVFYFHVNRGDKPYFKVFGTVWDHDNVTHWKPQ